ARADPWRHRHRPRPQVSPGYAGGTAGASCSTARTLASEDTATQAAAITTAAASSVERVPSAAASGPTTAYPAGLKTIEPIQSYALTREIDPAGMRSCSAVNQSAFPNALPPKPSAADAATTAVGNGGSSSAGSSAQSPNSTKPVASGRRGLKRSA